MKESPLHWSSPKLAWLIRPRAIPILGGLLQIGENRFGKPIYERTAILLTSMMMVMMMALCANGARRLRRIGHLRNLARIELSGLLGNRRGITGWLTATTMHCPSKIRHRKDTIEATVGPAMTRHSR